MHELNAVTARDALRQAGLNWIVEKRPLMARLDTGDMVSVPNHYATIRVSDNAALGVVGKKYVPIQNYEAFDFLDSVIGQSGLTYDSAGTFHDGAQVWMLAELEGIRIEPIQGDVTKSYLLLYNSHDGKSSFNAAITTKRLVCQNMLRVILGTSRARQRVQHSSNYKDKLAQAEETLNTAIAGLDKFREYAETSVRKSFTDAQFRSLTEVVMPVRDEEKGISTHLENNRKALMDIWTGGDAVTGARGTQWGALQAVTQYTTHTMRQRNPIQGAWFGAGNRMNQQAIRALGAM